MGLNRKGAMVSQALVHNAKLWIVPLRSSNVTISRGYCSYLLNLFVETSKRMQFRRLVNVIRVRNNYTGIEMANFLRGSLYSSFPIFCVLYSTKKFIILTLKFIQFWRVKLGIKRGLSVPDWVSFPVMREDSFICGINLWTLSSSYKRWRLFKA